MDIQRASHLDESAVTAIDRACFHEPTVDLATELARPWSFLFLARPDGAETPPGALLLAWLVADEMHILSVATLPDQRRRGLARALMNHALAFAATRGVRLVILEVRRSNVGAIALYHAFGFERSRIRPRYYADNQEDALEMTLVLPAPPTGTANEERSGQ